MRQAVALTVVAAVIVLIGGCGNEQNDEAPAACLAGNQAYLRSLESAPADYPRLTTGIRVSLDELGENA